METNKLIHLYFDWNVFKYIKNPRNEHDIAFSSFIYSIKNYVFIAYSPFHISGLLKNFDESKWDYILADCSFISEITNNLCIFYDNENQIHLEYRDPLEMFKDRLETNNFTDSFINPENLYQLMSEEQKKDFEINFYEVKEKMGSNPISDPFARIFIDSQNPEEAFKKITSYNMKLPFDPETYKDMRSNMKDNLQLLNNLSESEKDKINNELKSRGINKNIDELDNNDILSLSKQFLEQTSHTDMSSIYILKDLFGITKPEKISQKNTFNNIIDDSLHLEMAKYSLYYITEDKSNLEKSKLVSEEIGMFNNIFTIEEANKYIKISLFTHKDEHI